MAGPVPAGISLSHKRTGNAGNIRAARPVPREQPQEYRMARTMNLAGQTALGLLASMAWGLAAAQDQGDCGVSYTRTACPGKEVASYAKCGGQTSCVQYVPAASLQACQEAALKACANDRLDITKSKVIRATYKGQSIKSASGKDDFCIDYARRAAEFDQCGK
jgi:hypothetical protein